MKTAHVPLHAAGLQAKEKHAVFSLPQVLLPEKKSLGCE